MFEIKDNFYLNGEPFRIISGSFHYFRTVPYVTSDGPWNEPIFKSGLVEEALPTGNFGSAADWQFGQMKKFIGGNKPLMCMEFWNGWFDAWGEEHHVTPPEKAGQSLRNS